MALLKAHKRAPDKPREVDKELIREGPRGFHPSRKARREISGGRRGIMRNEGNVSPSIFRRASEDAAFIPNDLDLFAKASTEIICGKRDRKGGLPEW